MKILKIKEWIEQKESAQFTPFFQYPTSKDIISVIRKKDQTIFIKGFQSCKNYQIGIYIYSFSEDFIHVNLGFIYYGQQMLKITCPINSIFVTTELNGEYNIHFIFHEEIIKLTNPGSTKYLTGF